MDEKQTLLFGFGALNVTSVKLTGVEETYSNPNLDNKPFAIHKPLKTINSFRGKNILYPNFKYQNSNRKRKKKKKKRPSIHTNDTIHTAQRKILSPRKRKFVRPSSAIPSKSNHKNKESIQYELMKKHLNDLDELKQEITDQMKRNDNHNGNISKSRKKIFVPSPKTSQIIPINKERNNHNNEQDMNNINLNRPKHQSFQNMNQNPKPILDIVIKKNQNKRWKAIIPKSDTSNRKKVVSNTPKIPRYQVRNRNFAIKNRSIYSRNGNTYYSFHDQPVIAQPTIKRVNVGTDDIRLSSTFASNTPRIIPLNKIAQNPSYYKAMTNSINNSKHSKSKKKAYKRPWSTKLKTKHKKKKKKLYSKKKKKYNKKKRERPKSAPVLSLGSYQHPSMKSYMDNIEKNLEENYKSQSNQSQIEYIEECWNPFEGITVFELQYLISFLETKQDEYQIEDETLDILDQCLNFYVVNDSYETAWNAWNIIQRFLLPDTNKIQIDKNLCRNVLHHYQAQSRDLKHNHIDEELFDGIIQAIGVNIAAKIPNRQQFTIQFEKFVIEYQQMAQEIPEQTVPKKPIQQRPQSAAPVLKPNDLIHGQRVNVLNIESETESEDRVKYCLDGVIDTL